MSHDAPANSARPEGTTRGKYWWLRWVVIGVAVVVLTVEVTLVWDQLAKAFNSLYAAKWLWVLAALIAALASMHSFAQIQRTLLKSAGVAVKQWRSEAAFYAGNALSTTMPGGPVLSTTFLYRQQRLWGASPVVASWQLVMSGVLQAVGLALLGLGGAFLLGASKNPLSLIFTLGGFVALLLLAQAVASRPDLIDGIGIKVLSWVNSVRGKPADTGVDKWREHLQQLEAVSLGRRDLSVAFSWSLFNWVADVACLAFAAYAAGGRPSLAGLTVAYAAARAVGTIPLMPDGLLVVEAVLVPGLVTSGMALATAISAMLIYRLISWIFIAAIGWVVFFFMFRTEKDVDPDAPVVRGEL
ncbi:TIGR00374 family protein [Mycolicibacterium agri]|uniref:TIGR00374 family protein n=1 Tax=Mycolicibacterium agri TaxID=36811 RepID=A0A2A7N4W4_MYCAG|nr:YbhN family protein [Mycolicibacterium agri]PEG38890.1 TIGR00374 family protein [Mycolicibacterium agri]